MYKAFAPEEKTNNKDTRVSVQIEPVWIVPVAGLLNGINFKRILPDLLLPWLLTYNNGKLTLSLC